MYNHKNELIYFKLYTEQELGFPLEIQKILPDQSKDQDDDEDTDEEYLYHAQKRCKKDLIEAISKRNK